MAKKAILLIAEESVLSTIDDLMDNGVDWRKEYDRDPSRDTINAVTTWKEAYDNPLPACCKDCNLWIPNTNQTLWGTLAEWGECTLPFTLHDRVILVSGFTMTHPNHFCKAIRAKEVQDGSGSPGSSQLP